MLTHVKALSAIILVIVALFGLARTSFAQIPTPITVTSVQLTTNMNTMQVTVNWTGDGNGDATVSARYWRQSQGSSYADTTVTLETDYTAHRFIGDIFWLDEGTTYVVEVTVDDPDGGGGTWTPSATTRTPEGHGATYRQIWVSPSGSGANSGLSSGSPKQTIAQAVAMMVADGHKGQQIRLMPGIYHEKVDLTFAGDASHYNSIVGDGDPDSVIIDGSETALQHATWYPHIVGGVQAHDVWKTPYTPAAFESIYVGVAGWGQRLYRKDSVADLISPAAYQPDQGWYFNPATDTLYARLESGADPNATTMHFGVRHTLRLWSAFWRAESLTTRFSHGDGFTLGAEGSNYATNAVVRNCKSYNNWYAGIHAYTGTGGVLIDNNYLWDGRIDTWNYLACKGRYEEASGGIALSSAASNNIVRNNTVTGVFDGIAVGGGGSNKAILANTDLNNNHVRYTCDDGFEIDDTHAVNLAMWGNEIVQSNFAISLAPILTGPAYIMYNTVWNGNGGLKQGGGSTGKAYIVHNTFNAKGPFTSSWSVGGHYYGKKFYNNILTADGTTSYYPILDDAANRGDAASCDFDYDLLYHYVSGGGVFAWGGTGYSTIANLRSAKGWELHGVVGKPTFADTSLGDYRPTSTSPSIDIGERVMGINTPHLTLGGSAMYSGYPDAGAFDYNSTAPPTPHSRFRGVVPAALSFHFSAPRPNPSSGSAAFVVTLGAGQFVEASIYDVSGRLVRRLLPRQWLTAGDHELAWNGRDDRGAVVGSGMFLVRCQTPNKSVLQRVVRLR